MEKSDLIVRKSFSISHNNGEMWAENLDALYDFSDIIESKFMEDLNIIRRPSSPSIIAINLNQTVISSHLAELIFEGLISVGNVRKVSFVGVDKKGFRIMKRTSKKYKMYFEYRYFNDFVKAKDWLIPK